MKTIFEATIRRGGYVLADMLAKIDAYHVEGKLTDAERDELYEQARAGANAMAEMDVREKMAEFERRITALESAAAAGGTEEDTEYREYVPGKWYYGGAKITFGGEKYDCIAPDGVVCTWSPAEYPAYWEMVAV